MAGRPRKEEPNKKEKHISIRVTKEEYDAIKKVCYEKNMTFRDVLLHEIPKKPNLYVPKTEFMCSKN